TPNSPSGRDCSSPSPCSASISWAMGCETGSIRRRRPVVSENLLEVRNLTITPAGAQDPVLDDVSLSLAAGERVGLIGESGSGKSLTAQSVMGLLPEEQIGRAHVRT